MATTRDMVAAAVAKTHDGAVQTQAVYAAADEIIEALEAATEDEIDPSVEAGTLEYWKHRSRQWQKRCLRAEGEKSELILELARMKGVAADKVDARRDRADAIRRGDVAGTGAAPTLPRGWR